MGDADDLPGPDSEHVIERGETYEHDEYGSVEVTGIWEGVEQVDTVHNTEMKDVVIVRYSTEQKGESVDELTDTLDEFLEKSNRHSA